MEVSAHFPASRREANSHCLIVKDVKLAGSGGFPVDGTHAEAQGSAGLSLSGIKEQRASAGMHVPTAAVVRPAQRSRIGIIGARERVLSGGRGRPVSGGHAIHRTRQRHRHRHREVYTAYREKTNTCKTIRGILQHRRVSKQRHIQYKGQFNKISMWCSAFISFPQALRQKVSK